MFNGLSPRREIIGWTGIALALAGVFFAGRWSKHPAVEVRTVTVTEKTAEHQEAAKTAAFTGAFTGGMITRWKVRKAVPQPAPLPPGCPACLCDEAEVEQDVRVSDTKNLQLASVAASSKVSEASTQTAVRLEAPARWHLQVYGGTTFHGEREVGGAVTYRLAGAFTLSVYGSNHAVAAGAGVTF